VTDDEAMQALKLLAEAEGIIAAIETAHALAGIIKQGQTLKPGSVILLNLSGRGDKDMETVGKYFGFLGSKP
ncbi:MAG: pyridoxal-phosphate dependent enzyme, partial [Microbacteriaceae bacterium]|nr:pyridoxal-phosphate dependent enzyme [Microbacteriaceae bacterium]